jgi:hypothetical protein
MISRSGASLTKLGYMLREDAVNILLIPDMDASEEWVAITRYDGVLSRK